MAWWDDLVETPDGEDPYLTHASDTRVWEQAEAELNEPVAEAVSAE